MPINSFDRLQKDIDALTYNARAVLQALQESALAGGTSKGFRIVRADREITLTRVDIYRLYTFYKEWENNNFAVSDETDGSGRSILGFNTIRINHDKKPVRDDSGIIVDAGATSTALSKHGRIMYMNRENESMYSTDSYWYTLIASAANPKLITNSAPIPLNLRTPIYDPNLSTTHYNSHPTYLLPNGYHLLDIVGYEGDGKDHYLGGDTWDISATKLLSFGGDYITVGEIDRTNSFKTATNRVDQNAFVWGYNTFAPAKYATAGGFSSAAIGASSVAIGNLAFASNDNSVVLGGISNKSLHTNSGVFVGSYNAAYGDKSIVLGGSANITGDAPYEFELAHIDGTSTCYSSCVSTCQSATNSVTTVSTPGYDIIRIRKSISNVNLNVGDVVLMYALKTASAKNKSASPESVDGSYYPSIKRTIVSISADVSTGYTIVTFDLGLPLPYHVGGMIARVAFSSSMFDLTENTEYGSGGKKPLGYNSATVGGWSLVANGIDQVVVGRLNRNRVGDSWDSTYDARFMVGSGYVTMQRTGSSASIRSNILELYDNAMILSLDGKLTSDDAFNGIISAQGKQIDGNGTKLNGTEIVWHKGVSTESLLKVMYPAAIDGLSNIGVLVSSKMGAYVRGGDTYITATDSHNLKAKRYTSNVSTTTRLNAKEMQITGSDSVSVYGKEITLSSGTSTNIQYGTHIKFSGAAYGSYGGMFIPCSTGTSFTSDSSNVLLTPNKILNSSIAEVILPAQSSTKLTDEYPPDSYLGVLDAGTSPRRAHIMTMAGTAEPGTSRGSLMQLMWGECTVGNIRYADYNKLGNRAWTGNLCVRKGLVTAGSARFTPWEPIPSMDDIDNAITHRFASMSYNKESISSLYGNRTAGYIVSPKKGHTLPWFSRDWFYVDKEAISRFDVMFEQVGSLTLCTCEYIIAPISDYAQEEHISDGSFIMVILDVGANRLKCKPKNTASGYACNSYIDANKESHILTAADATLSPLYPVFIDGIHATYPMVSNGGEPSVTPDSNLLRIFIPVKDVNEFSGSVVGRFSVTYKNLV